jgi:energy-coupling factor transporter transmembrane protein EcfT
MIHDGRKIFWIGFDIVFFGFCFLFSLVIADPKGIIFYYDGLHRTPIAFGLAFLILPFILLYIGVLVIRVISWKRNIKSLQWLWLLGIAGILCNPIVAMMIPRQSPGYVSYARGFHQRMKEHLDVDPVRQWLETLDDNVFQDRKWIKASDEFLPPDVRTSIAILRPGFLEFFKTEEGFNCVKIATSSGGISRICGVVIGPQEMPIPPSEEACYNEESYHKHGELRIQLEDGVYVWHD